MSPPPSLADLAILASAPLFSEIGPAFLPILVAQATVIERRGGGPVFMQGDPADRFFLVLEGRVSLFTLMASGERSIIEVIEAGQTFAEAAMFADACFPLTAEAAPATRLIEIPARPFLAGLAENRGLAAKLLAGLARWQRRLWSEIADLKSRTPAQRLGLFLLGLARYGGDGREIELPLTKSELASRIGITPESLSRALARLRPLGVTTQGRKMRIGDISALRDFCGDG